MKRIVKGDKVKVVSGKNKNQEGTVLAVLSKNNRVLIDGVNKVKCHIKANKNNSNDAGGIVEKEAGIDLSNVMLIDPKQKTGTVKVAYIMDKNNNKIRSNRKTNVPLIKGK